MKIVLWYLFTLLRICYDCIQRKFFFEIMQKTRESIVSISERRSVTG